MTSLVYNLWIFPSRFWAYWSKMFNEAWVELNWKNVVTLKINLDSLILGSFSNNTSSIDEEFIWKGAITNFFVTGKLKALYHGDHYYCQCQVSKKIKEKILFLILWIFIINLWYSNKCSCFEFCFVGLLHISSNRYI